MEPWQQIVMTALALTVLLAVRSAIKKRRGYQAREFDRRLETVLQPRETVKVVCPTKKGRCILTSKRLLLEEGVGFLAVPFDRIKSVQGLNQKGNRTTSIEKMVRLTVKADKDYIVKNSSDQFPELAKQLINKIKKQNEKKKTKKK